MSDPAKAARNLSPGRILSDHSGFSLAEFVVASLILIVVSAALFTLLGSTQRTASYQTEVQAVMANVRVAMDTVERILRQAGNDPLNVGIEGVAITSSTEVRIRTDLTGSAGGSNPDKGDPDGDTSDSGEDLTIRYNSTAKTLEVVPGGGSAQTVAAYITAFTLQYYDANGATTSTGANVKRINISMSAGSTLPNPQTGQTFSIQLASDVQLATRQ